MSKLSAEFDELRLGIERLRALLENLIVRGLRTCGTDELLQLHSFTEYLERAGAGHVAAMLAELHAKIEKNDRESPQTLLHAQTAVRLLERLLTLRVVRSQYQLAAVRLDQSAAGVENEAASDDEEEGE